MRSDDAFQCIVDELMLDGNARQNLATFCQTWEEPEIHRLMDIAIDKNLIDKDEYPQTAELERRCVHMLADLWNAPETGTGRWGARPSARRRPACSGAWRPSGGGGPSARPPASRPTTPNMVCGPVQVVWHKFARYWDVEMREIPMSPGRYCMDVEQMLERVDENTIMVVPTFGVTYTGAYEPVLELSQALDKLQEETGLDIDIHVDGASGAFLAPFCAPDILWDFRVPRVKSISTSGHKFGLAPLGVGWVLWRDVAELPDDLIFHVTYLGGDMPVFQINFSRPAGQIVAQYYNFVRLGRDGYRNVHDACYLTGKFLAHEIAKLGPFEMLCDVGPPDGDPVGGLAHPRGRGPGVHALRHRRPAAQPRLAGTGLPADRVGVRHLGAAHPGAPGRQPGPGDAPPRRHEAGDRALRPSPGLGADDQGGVRGLQPPVGDAGVAGGSAPGSVTLAVQSTWMDAAPQEPRLADLGGTVGRPRGRGREREARPATAGRARSSSGPRRSGATPPPVRSGATPMRGASAVMASSYSARVTVMGGAGSAK